MAPVSINQPLRKWRHTKRQKYTFKNLDMYGETISFLMDGESKLRTSWGGCVSLAVYTIGLLVALERII